jgi:transmembrane sensor
MSDEGRRVASAVEPELSEARMARQWDRIASRRRLVSRSRAWVWAPIGLLTVAVFAVVLVERQDRPLDGMVLESGADGVQTSLGEGSEIDLEPSSRLVFREERRDSVQIELDRGGARFDVAHVEGRRFVVAAGGFEVAVVGTRFMVNRAPGPKGEEEVRVSVEPGAVIVRPSRTNPTSRTSPTSRTNDVRVEAGESWSSSGVAETSREDDGDLSEGPDTATNEPSPKTPRPAPHRRSSPTKRNDARHLFDAANVARRAGLIHEAAARYQTLLERFPDDGRAALAAFELGRLRMDSLTDPKGAIVALKRAIELAPRASFVEDAMARIVYAKEAEGDLDNCTRARAAYLERYPHGVHASSIASRCAPR